MENSDVHDSVKDYYGKRLQSRDDLQTQACVTPGKKITKPVREAIAAVHHEVAIRYYGCGLAIPEKLEGMKILDLGSGSGRDCFALSKLVGSSGYVTGIDMTDEQIAISRKFIDYHMEKFGYSHPNVEFIQGYIEKLREAGLKDNYYDIIISNCTVNLSPDKRAVIQEAYNVLKDGGELFFSDIYVDRELDDSIRKHEILWGEGFSGALYWKDLHKFAADVGFSCPFLVTATPVSVDRDDFKKILGDAKYVSATYRLFKLPANSKETRAQVIYNGEIPDYAEQLAFDHQHTFKKGDGVNASAEVVAALKCSRFSDEFDYQPASNNCETEQNGTTTMEDPFHYIAEKEKKGEKIEAMSCGGSKACS